MTNPVGRSSAPILFPSGEDANPLNRRLPAEVVTRQRKVAKPAVQEKEKEEVQVDLRTVLALKPDARPKWLSRAFKMAEEGKASATDLYDILSSRKFAAGIPSKVGRKLCAIVTEQTGIFSDKQQRYLRSEEWVLSKYGASQPEADDKDDDVDEPAIEPVRETERDLGREKERDTAREKAADRDRHDRLAGAFEPIDGKEHKGQWTSKEREDIRARERAREAKAKAFDGSNREQWLEGLVESAKKRETQQQQARRRQAEEEADSSLDLLERLAQQKQQKQQREASPEPAKSRRNADKDRDRDRDGGRRKRGRSRSRSRSISIKSPSASPQRRKRGRSGKRAKKNNLDDLIRQRMAERDREVDSARIPVVDPGHAQRWT